jgi:hypothetical protein
VLTGTGRGLAGTGLSDRVVYGIYPVAAPLIAGGLVLAGITAARAENYAGEPLPRHRAVGHHGRTLTQARRLRQWLAACCRLS